MLIFKHNIYDLQQFGQAGFFHSPDPEYDNRFDPRHFIEAALEEDRGVLSFIEHQPRMYWKEDTREFYPRSGKTGGIFVLRQLMEIIEDGLKPDTPWCHMNTYHFCFLYDVLSRYAFNYNHDNRKERLKALPELAGMPLRFDYFVKNYFFNTVFLLDEEEYNSLTAEEKQQRGFDCPCQFAVINGLAPTREELQLQESRNYPYSVYV